MLLKLLIYVILYYLYYGKKISNLLYIRMNANNVNTNINTNIDNNSLYLDLTDGEIVAISNNMDLPNFIRQSKYLLERLQQINNTSTE